MKVVLFLLLFLVSLSKKVTHKPHRKLATAVEDPDKLSANSDNDLMVMGMSKNLVLRVDNPEDSKPTYINMSPLYDYRGGYLI